MQNGLNTVSFRFVLQIQPTVKEQTVIYKHSFYRYGKAENGVYRDYNSMFVLDEITCLGNETILGQCSHSPWLEHHCVSFENFYAGVCCSNDSSFGGNPCAYFPIRLDQRFE